MKKKLSVAFLWHMHQPMYKDLLTGEYHLPWVRLHSTYAYLDMVSVLEEFPDIRCTFNLTPSLVWQLEDISNSETVNDRYLKLSKKNAGDLTDKEKCFVLKHFFSCNPATAIEPVKKYRHLYFARGNDLSDEALLKKIKEYSTADLRDLQVFFNLAWCGFTLKKKDPIIRTLMHQGGNYTEIEKLSLLKRQKEVVASIIPTYKRLQDEGRIEIWTSPFYHPILPLLWGREEHGGVDYKEDIKAQIVRAVDLYENIFGRKPVGMWPSEGSVSQEIIPFLADAGIKWMATDEGILLESFNGKDISRENLVYRAYIAEEKGKEIGIVFRDINLSNAISFKYSQMHAKKAGVDLLDDISGIKKFTESNNEKNVVPIILDGENPWPYFKDGGRKFLSRVYGMLSSAEDIETVTIGGYMESCGKKRKIEKLHSGSWIDRNFRKWTGSPQKNKAWEYLDKAKKAIVSSVDPSREALEELYIAEGSDWFWWYDDFGTEMNFIFDKLFRSHLSNVYKLIDRKTPHYLEEPVLKGPSVQKLNGTNIPAEMPRSLKILLVASEVVPYAKTGGLADIAGSLPKALAALGCDVRVMMPLYKCVTGSNLELILESHHIKHSGLEGMFGFSLYSHRADGVTTYFVRNKRYFERDGLYGTPKGDHRDNALRFSFFSKAILAAIPEIDFNPDIIHCNDWQTALVPFYLRYTFNNDRRYDGIKTLFTIHNMAYQGIFSKGVMHRIGIPKNFFNMNALEFYGKINFMKSGILYSDAINTVSHRYAEEIMTPDYGAGLDGLILSRKNNVYGIPNGVDYSVWSPKNDSHIKTNFDIENIDKKRECKKDLIEYTRLPLSADTPIIGSVTRLAEQKGMDLVADIMERLVKLGVGVVVLGSGSDRYNKRFAELASEFPKNVYVGSGFNDELAHKIEAGSDMFVMPSRYEPCGLNQMYSIKYGTIPIVRATGGLDDVITDFDEDRERGNGFKFGPATTEALYSAIDRALQVYKDKPLWKKLMVRAMEYDFSWRHSAEQYLELYRRIVS